MSAREPRMVCEVTLAGSTTPCSRWSGPASRVLATVRRYHAHAKANRLTVSARAGGITVLLAADGSPVITLRTTTTG